MFRIFIFLLFSTYCLSTLLAQEDSHDTPKYDTNYIKDLSDRLSIRVYGISKFKLMMLSTKMEFRKIVAVHSFQEGLPVGLPWYITLKNGIPDLLPLAIISQVMQEKI